jgi:hypothetical protein
MALMVPMRDEVPEIPMLRPLGSIHDGAFAGHADLVLMDIPPGLDAGYRQTRQ